MWTRDSKNTPWSVEPNVEASSKQECFYHSWKPILLLNQTVYNCAVCDKKKEVYEEEQKAEAQKRAEMKTDYPFW